MFQLSSKSIMVIYSPQTLQAPPFADFPTESRMVALKHYKIVAGPSCVMYFNYHLDILYLSTKSSNNGRDVLAFVCAHRYQPILKIRRLAFDDDGLIPLTPPPPPPSGLLRPVTTPYKASHLNVHLFSAYLPSLDEINLVIVDRGASHISPQDLTLNEDSPREIGSSDWYDLDALESSTKLKMDIYCRWSTQAAKIQAEHEPQNNATSAKCSSPLKYVTPELQVWGRRIM